MPTSSALLGLHLHASAYLFTAFGWIQKFFERLQISTLYHQEKLTERDHSCIEGSCDSSEDFDSRKVLQRSAIPTMQEFTAPGP